MTIRRRTLLAAVPGLLAGVAYADDAIGKLRAYEKTIGGRIGLYAADPKSGAKIAWRADERFAMCSTFKASLAACVLARVDRGENALDRLVTYDDADILDYAPVAKANLANGALSVAELCGATVELSDNTYANLLLARIGGPAALTAFWRSTGDTVARLDHNEPLLNRTQPPDPSDTTTPAAMASSLQRFVLGDVLSPASRDLLTGWMRNCMTGTDMLRAGLPATWAVGDKTGNNGKDALGDIAVAWPRPDRPLVICAYTQGGTVSAAELRRLFADIAQLIAGQLS